MKLTAAPSYAQHWAVSNLIRYDSLLVRALAAELNQTLRGRRIRALILDAEALRASIVFSDDALVLELHPQDGRMRIEGAGKPEGGLRFPAGTAIAAVTAPPDERLMDFALAGEGKVKRIVVELITNQWNVLALDDDGRIIALLRTREGKRPLRVGAAYPTPARGQRLGADQPLSRAEWHTLLTDVNPRAWPETIVRAVAYTSPQNVGTIIGDAGVGAIDDAFTRYLDLVAGPAEPAIVNFDGGAQPYPRPLPPLQSERAASLLDAMLRAAEAPVHERAPEPELVVRAHARIDALRKRVSRLEAQAEPEGASAAELRATADLILACAGQLQRGMAAARLTGFDGNEVEIALEPALSPVENATRYYDQARKRERAAARVPAMIARAEREITRIEAKLSDLATRPEAAAELVSLLGDAGPARQGGDAAPLPYRRYTSSGGLEIRVGRSSAANDKLTFHHSAPNDIWLHARDNAGAHVILRWKDATANPPQRDLIEAAVLAALHSKARSSGTVAVDWTRRKHVRKPRKSPPGTVLPERVKTVFVAPDAEVGRRLREE